MSKVIFYTYAYNATRTLPRTVESVIAQTCSDWVWYLLDNGSTDDTGRVIRDYAKRDARIIPLINRKNHVWEPGNDIGSVIWRQNEDDFFCFLDADDAYKPDFLAKMLAFASAHRLEIAICGHYFIDAGTGRVTGQRVFGHSLFLEGEGFSDHFSMYHQFMRTMWGKLYAISTAKKINWNNIPSVAYGWDTLYVMENFRNASRVGILAESLHEYYVSPKSISYQLDPKRITSDRILFDAARDFLMAKCGAVSLKNRDVLFGTYMYALKDSLSVLLNAKIEAEEKLRHLRDMLDCDHSKQLAALESFGDWLNVGPELRGERKKFFRSVADWLLSLQEVPNEQLESICDMGEFACAAGEHAEGWVFFNKLRIRLLIDQGRAEEGRAKLDELGEVLPGDADLEAFRAQLPH